MAKRRGSAKSLPLTRIANLIRKRGTEGALTRQAKARGMSVKGFCAAVKAGRIKASTKTKRRCALAATFAKHRPKKGKR